MQIVAMVSSTDLHPWAGMVKSVKDTWGSDPRIKTICYYSRRASGPQPEDGKAVEYDGNVVCGATDEEGLRRGVVAMEYVAAKYSPDYFLFCCSGSYFVVPEVLRFIADKPRTGFYCGIIGHI